MLKVLGRANSINVQKVMWCCAELELAVERVDIGGPFGGNREPAYLRKNPNGLVPTLEDGDFVLWESHSIVRYLAGTYGDEPWFPADGQKRALASQWMDWVLSALHAPMTAVYRALVRTPPGERDMDAVGVAWDKVGALMAILDSRLAETAYVTGDQPSMADIALGGYPYRWFTLPLERPALDNLEAWYGRLRDRAAYRDTVMLPLT
ncbi:MAG: glutathione S-transferase family protein [Rhodospirillales bacterium]